MGEKLSLRRRVYNGTMTVLVRLGAVLTCGLLLFLIGYIFYRGIPGLSWEILTTQTSYIKNTVGRIITTRVRLPASTPACSPIFCTKNSMPTKPKMMDGMPVRVSVANSMTRTSFALLAYSVR